MRHMIDMIRHHSLQRKGQRYLNSGLSAKALVCFEKAILLQNDPEDQFNLALALVGLGRFAEALGYLDKVVEREPDREVVLLLLADCYLQTRRWDDAISMFQKLLEMRPGSERYEDYLALARDPVGREKHVIARELFGEAEKLMDEKKPQEALDKMKEAFEMNPHNAIAANNIGSLMLALKMPAEEAMLYFEKAVALEPSEKKYRENLSWVKRKVKL